MTNRNTPQVPSAEQSPIVPQQARTVQADAQKKVSQTMDALYAKFQCLVEDPDEHRLVRHTDANGYTQMRMGNAYYSADNIYYPWGILRGAEIKLNLYIAQCGYILPDEFFNYITALISEYDSLTGNGDHYYKVTHGDPHKDKDTAIIFAQIRAAQANPYVLKDPRGMKIYEALANMKSKHCFPLYNDASFIDSSLENLRIESGVNQGYIVNRNFPVAGIGPEHIESVLRIAANGKIMNGTNEHFKEWWVKGLRLLAATLMPTQERIASKSDRVVTLSNIPPIEPIQVSIHQQSWWF